MANNIDISTAIDTIAKAFEGRQVRQALVNGLTAAQEAINAIDPTQSAVHGTTEVTLEEDVATVKFVELDLPFTPTENTQIILSLRYKSQPTLQAYITYAMYADGHMRAAITPTVQGADAKVKAGTYNIDWLVTDKG